MMVCSFAQRESLEFDADPMQIGTSENFHLYMRICEVSLQGNHGTKTRRTTLYINTDFPIFSIKKRAFYLLSNLKSCGRRGRHVP